MTVIIHRLAILILCLMRCYVRAATLTERYIIYPKEGLSLQVRQQFTRDLDEFVGSQGNVYTSIRHKGTSDEMIRFWCADLTQTAYNVLRRDTRVSDIHVRVAFELFTEYESSERNGTHLIRPTSKTTPSNSNASEDNIAYVTQNSPVASELRALSQPAWSGPISHYPNYVYPVGRKRSYIYHVELGIDPRHPDFDGRRIEWLYTEVSMAMRADTMTEAAVAEGHSTCTASKAVGNMYGASKTATLVVVKMPYLAEETVFEVLDTVIDDIRGKGRRWTSVVSISWGVPDTSTSPLLGSIERVLERQIHELLAMDVVVVCAAGNAAQKRTPTGELRTFVDTYPAVFEDSPLSLFDFFVVGNSDINGYRSPDSQSTRRLHQLYAPGVEIKCANNSSPRGYATGTGTSFSAPLVAGVLADLLSTDDFEAGPFWRNRMGGQNVVWNRVTDAQNPPVFESGNATLLNYTSPVFAATTFGDEQLDVSTS